MPPAEFLELIERISAVDGSTGWVASFGSQLIYLGSLPLESQAKLYADGPDVVFAGALFPVQQATPTERGFLVNGRWKFASGCMAADIVCVGIQGDDTTSGKPRGALVRPERLEIVQDWDVIGMQGTGSFDLVAKDVEVDREWTFIRGGEPVIDEPLYRYPAITYAAQVLSVVSAGVARAALDFAEEVGSGRASITGAPKLADRAYYRAGIAEAEATLRVGARLLLRGRRRGLAVARRRRRRQRRAERPPAALRGLPRPDVPHRSSTRSSRSPAPPPSTETTRCPPC